MNAQPALIPRLCLAGAVLLWGTSFMATKFALAGFAPMTVIFLRMSLASLLMALFWSRVPPAAPAKGDAAWLALLCLLQPCLYFLLEGYAVKLTTSSQAGLISSLVPLLVAAGAYAFLREPLTARMALGLVLSLLGVALLSLCGSTTEHAPNPALGNTLELLAMCCASGYMLVLKHLSSRYDTWRLTGLQALSGAVFFLPGALYTDPLWLTSPALAAASVPATAWAAIAYLGCVVTLGAFGLYNMAAARMPSAQAAAAINVVPLVAVLAGWAMLDEALAPTQIAACAVILGGVGLGQCGGRRRG